MLWRVGLRIHEALSLTETDLDERRGSIFVRHGRNDRRREVGMDAWGWAALEPWLADRAQLPVGPLFCVLAGPTSGRAWSASSARIELHHLARAPLVQVAGLCADCAIPRWDKPLAALVLAQPSQISLITGSLTIVREQLRSQAFD